MTNTTATEDDTRPLLEKARAAMRGRAEIEAGLADVTTRLRRARAAARPEEDVLDAAFEAVIAGQEVPADVADRVLTIRRSNESAFAEAGVLGPLEHRLREQLLAVHRRRADDGLNVLATELHAVLTAAGPVLAELGSNVDDAASAIEADRVVQWREATALAERYDELRRAQRVLVSAAVSPQAHVSDRVSPEARSLVDDFGIVRDAGLHYPEVGTGVNRSEVRTGEVRIFSGRLVTSDHSDRPARACPWLTGDPVADLRFVTRADVQPWVPAINELTGARDEHQAWTQDEARAEAERLPGYEPETFMRTGRTLPPPPAALIDRLAREELGEPV